MKREDAIWLAGLFDAGGGARAYRTGNGKRGGTRFQFSVWITCAEPATIEEVHRVVGGGSICRQTSPDDYHARPETDFTAATKRRRPGRSTRFMTSAAKGRELADAIRPFTRVRGPRIDTAFAVYHEHRKRRSND